MIRLIAAVADRGVIGKDGTIPWDVPEDRKMFKEITMGGTLIMGRKTYESLPGSRPLDLPEMPSPLPGRNIIVVTSQTGTLSSHVLRDRETVRTARDLNQAIRMATSFGEDEEVRDIFLCGGEQIYKEGLRYAGVLYITRIELAVDGDAFFPDGFEKDYVLIERQRLSACATLMIYREVWH